MNISKRWFRSGGAGWHPGLYEWFFSNTRRGVELRAQDEEIIYRLLEGTLKSTHSILEFGPGTGNYTVPLARRCARVVTIEPSEAMQEYLRRRLEQEGLTNVETQLGRLQDGVGATEKFDGALVIGPLYYVRDLKQGLLALTAALKPGGWTIFNVPLRTPEGWFQFLNELFARRQVYLRSTEETIKLTEEVGLNVERLGTVGTTRRGLNLVVQARRA
ncbi:MAG TPA: class I SAM-dependent methyltransferase [Rubrobacteraceae bacterium]|nr:class I SAM-dependent methyltransferase [Rubrobacteraceae bacterium]